MKWKSVGRRMVIPDCQNTGIGKEFAWSTNVLDPLFRVGTTYENGCDQSSWISGEWHFPFIRVCDIPSFRFLVGMARNIILSFGFLFQVSDFYSDILEFGMDSPSTYVTTFCFCIYRQACHFDEVFLAFNSIFWMLFLGY
jgi:hypothetical protein